MISFVGFVSLPAIAANETPYEAIEQPDGRYGVQRKSDLMWFQVQPSGHTDWRPKDSELGNFELSNKVEGGLMYRPLDGLSFLLPTEDVG